MLLDGPAMADVDVEAEAFGFLIRMGCAIADERRTRVLLVILRKRPVESVEKRRSSEPTGSERDALEALDGITDTMKVDVMVGHRRSRGGEPGLMELYQAEDACAIDLEDGGDGIDGSSAEGKYDATELFGLGGSRLGLGNEEKANAPVSVTAFVQT
ncbi:ABC transporter [Pseudozyma hubeiensis SY62]|uniref:ABC transporter n=1 Tax=Pseudozyma hubeiensis (strain SY62) TaxID=1305764 RepID=R9PDY7_PSEHS|nr:ABC transporter [Pseudozyma hubeiensis SY62]GAC99593.1 ABC transporter [Pseudozyma hubeiensis SY62]